MGHTKKRLYRTVSEKTTGAYYILYIIYAYYNEYSNIGKWYFLKLEKIKIPDLKLEKKSIYNKTEETTENSKIEKIQSNSYQPKIELPINESPKLLLKPGKKVFCLSTG